MTVDGDQQSLKVFYSYSHKDEAHRKRLETHLELLRRASFIDEWHDRKITAGQEWAGVIDDHLEAAHIILLLISANFLASDYCYDVEMMRALEQHKADHARVIPIILSDVDWKTGLFTGLQGASPRWPPSPKPSLA